MKRKTATRDAGLKPCVRRVPLRANRWSASSSPGVVWLAQLATSEWLNDVRTGANRRV